jgi:hypothetical protein
VKLTLLFSVTAIIIYLINCTVGRRWLKPKFSKMVVWFFGVGMIGVFSEVLLNTIITALFGHPLWEYRVLPIKHGYISLVGPILWGLFGIHLCLQNIALEKFYRRRKLWQKSLIMGADAMIMETIINALSIAILGKFFFYYFPPDLGHFTSLINLPLWAIGGVIIYKFMPHFLRAPRFAVALSIMATLGLLIS